MVLGSVAAVPSILISVSDGLWSIAVVDCVALLWLAFIRRRRESPFRWRARNFICLLYLLGLALLLKVGPAAQIYLMAGPVMTALLLGLRSALFALALNAATLLGVGYYANADIHLPGFAGAPLLEWIVITINFAFVNALMTVSSAVLLHKLEISLQKQSAITVSLAEGHERLRESEALYRATFENAPVGVSHLDLDGRWLAVNDELCEITGYSRDEMLSLRYGDIAEPEDVEADAPAMAALLRGDIPSLNREQRYIRKDGAPVWVHRRTSLVRNAAGDPKHLVVVATDITERVRYEVELEYQATHDALTGLANRNLLNDRLEQALAGASRHGRNVAVLFLDLDNFKIINDSLGHGVGDELIKSVGERLAGCVRDMDTVARAGGDEFVLILADAESENEVATAMSRILEVVAGLYQVARHELHVTCSIGASLFPRDGADPETLLKNADAAMYRAKEGGRNRCKFYQEEMNARLGQRLSLAAKLRHALERDELLLHYQPQVDLRSGAIVGAEALIRWRHPELGLVPPSQFIPIAEETGLIVPIGEWVLHAACVQAQSWAAMGLPRIRVAVNISARQFRHKGLLESIQQALRLSGIPPGYLEVEITESMIMYGPEETIRLLRNLKDLGLQIALDDFGTGFSSLSYLKRFPIDVLKIDQSFVRGIVSDREDAAIVKTVIGLAHSLELRTIAEGVETAEQAGLLRGWASDEVQGYHFSRPLDADAFIGRLREGRRFVIDG
ncbi:hypothetical protein MoryE10_10040 [Methylogaea oryzae]|uniref:cyclic-guanylate-specific phosphodiesterase n=2 Tax=Methylogaea oryzae TaxID=1295382 RepID=A0A8D4VM55_9GAMM|nr:hypothetical protein MoryE10_10040 [Methylogaea oryzae]